MKKILKENKAITLIALVVTIIILLILAGVTVGFAMNGTGLFEKAKLATDNYNNKVSEEETEINKATNSINDYIEGNRNTITEDILWEGTGTNGCEITLSQPLSNYKFIEIYFVNKDLGGPAPILKYDAEKILQVQQLYIYDSNRTWGYTSRYDYNSTTNTFKNMYNSYFGSSTTSNSAYYLEVYKIVGIK